MEQCKECNGTGRIVCPACGGSKEDPRDHSEPCGYCRGCGDVICNFCSGTGKEHFPNF